MNHLAPKRPSAVIFDWDNTLVDTWPAIHRVNNETLVEYGHEPWTWEETKTRVRKSMRESFPALFGDKWEEAGAFFYERFDAVHLEMLEPCPGAAEMLESLAAEGVYQGVVSNKKGPYLRKEAVHLGWDRYFGALVGASDAERDKPAVEPVDMALEPSGIPRGPEVWFAGDTDIDLECAANAGCVPVLVRELPPMAGEFGDFPPTLHFEGCLALSNRVATL